MAEMSYTKVNGKLKDLLAKIRDVAIPAKASNEWLKSIGFKSSNDASLLTVIKSIGLTDGNGKPSNNWNDYRGSNHKKVLGKCIQLGYSDLFSVYSDAWKRSNEELEHVVSTKTTSGKQVIETIVKTFQTLCSFADFDVTPSASREPQTTPTLPPVQKPADGFPDKHLSPSVHIDLQIHISPDAKPDQIDQIFASMSKHLYNR
jgi:hypothetical protein